jgi:hypothetical protein
VGQTGKGRRMGAPAKTGHRRTRSEIAADTPGGIALSPFQVEPKHRNATRCRRILDFRFWIERSGQVGCLLNVAELSDEDPLTPAPLPQGGEGRGRLSLRPRPLGGEGGAERRVRGFICQCILQGSIIQNLKSKIRHRMNSWIANPLQPNPLPATRTPTWWT